MLIVMCGPPGSGKTTLSNQLAEKPNTKVYHFDDIPGGHHLLKTEQYHRDMWNAILGDLKSGYDVVCDDIHVTLTQRRAILNAFRNTPYKKKLIVLNVPLAECIRHNNERERSLPVGIVEVLHNRFQPPTLDEGWDEILHINN